MSDSKYTLPSFLIIGAQKSGTTWLLETLKRHEKVYVAPAEVHFFNDEKNFGKGIQWYSNFFKEAHSGKLIGEKTPDYFSLTRTGDQLIPKLLHEYLPEVKLIVMLRSPVERAISAVKHHIRVGRINPRYSLDYIFNERQDLLDEYNILNYSKYDEILEVYLKYFNKDQIHISFYEEISSRPKRVVNSITQFLNLQYDETILIDDRVNAFKMSRLYLNINYHFPRCRKIARRLNSYFPAAKYTVSLETRSRLEDYFQSTKDFFNAKYNTPKEWKI